MHGRSKWVGVVYLVLAGLAAGAAGCAAVVIGGAAAGGALGYAYWRGAVSQDFAAGFPETWAATQAALADLQLQARLKQTGPAEGEIESRTADGETIAISLTARPGRLLADGVTTTVNVRVGTWGDRALSDHILARVQARLTPPAVGPPPPATPPATLSPPPETGPPPLADGPPAKQ